MAGEYLQALAQRLFRAGFTLTLSPTFTLSFASRWPTGKPRFVVVAAANAPFAVAIFDTDPSETTPVNAIGFAAHESPTLPGRIAGRGRGG